MSASMTGKLTFLKFTDKEFDAITEQLCNVFVTTRSELSLLYQEIADDFDKDGWPPHFVSRSFFKSEDIAFQKVFTESPVIAVDLPSLFELNNQVTNKPTVIILGQDAKSAQDAGNIRLGTPYGLHHKGSREILVRTKFYFEMITTFFDLGYRVYLTDIYKVWVCDPNRPYYGVKLPKVDQKKFTNVLKAELLIVNPVALVTWGKDAANGIAKIDHDIQHLKFPHPSGAANRTWKKLMNQSPSYENKLTYWNSVVRSSLPNRE
ncbi:MAG: hypothetical protein AAFW75_09125 [Cyanobacteria bacterium J06636_16]